MAIKRKQTELPKKAKDSFKTRHWNGPIRYSNKRGNISFSERVKKKRRFWAWRGFHPFFKCRCQRLLLLLYPKWAIQQICSSNPLKMGQTHNFPYWKQRCKHKISKWNVQLCSIWNQFIWIVSFNGSQRLVTY